MANEKILIVDDEEHIRELFKYNLEKNSHKYITAENGAFMYRAMILSALGEDETGIMVIFENNIDNLRNLTMEIRNAISTQEHASEYLKLKYSCSNTIEFMISSFRNIKLALDINFKNISDDSYEFRIYSVRNNIIELFSNLAKIDSAIERDNDELLNKYNEIVIDLLSNYN